MSTNKILILVTNQGEYEKFGMRTGLWLSELTHFYDYAEANGFTLELASPSGGHVPIDPESLAEDVLDDTTMARYRDRDFMNLLRNTRTVTEVDVEDYDTIYFTGGHGTMFDFTGDDLGAVTGSFYESGRVVSAVCHGPAGILNVTLSDGTAMICGKNVTGFSWPEEVLAQRDDAVPFSLQEALVKAGANYSTADKPFDTYVVEDGLLITGQNPGSAHAVAQAVVAKLKSR